MMVPREIEREAFSKALERVSPKDGLTFVEEAFFEIGWLAALRWLGTLSLEDADDMISLEKEP